MAVGWLVGLRRTNVNGITPTGLLGIVNLDSALWISLGPNCPDFYLEKNKHILFKSLNYYSIVNMFIKLTIMPMNSLNLQIMSMFLEDKNILHKIIKILKII